MINIYLITNQITGQRYVGKTVHTIEYRFAQHCNDRNHTYIDCALQAYGPDSFTVELLKQCPNEEWPYWETYYIHELHSHWTEGGYNLSEGGDHNPMDDPLVRKRHAEACASLEHREKLRIASTGKKHSTASKQRMSQIQKQVYSDLELRRKVKLNQPTVIPVKMLDSNDQVVREFDSLSDVCKYFEKDPGNTSALKSVLDKFNKNGTRAKFWGHAWVRAERKV